MGFLKKLFKKEEKPKVEEPTPVVKEEVVHPEGTVECNACNDPIFPWDKRKTYNKKKFHIKCYRKAIKMAKAQINSGITNI